VHSIIIFIGLAVNDFKFFTVLAEIVLILRQLIKLTVTVALHLN